MTKYRLDAAEIFAVKEQERSDYLEKVLAQILRGAKTFEDVINKGWRQFFTAALPAYAADFCELVRRLPRCSYQYSSYRRSFRSAEPGDYFGFLTAFLAEAYRDWQNFDLREYIQTNQHLVTDWDIVAKQPAKMTISALLALKIDQGDQNIIQLIKEMIFSDRNTAVLDHQIFRAVAASQNAELHKLMADLLLAAKLQEGLRQAILETADDGVLEYFMVLIKTVLDNDLMRFSSALRAVCVWTGLGYDYADRRVAEKILRLGYQYLTSAADRAAAHKSGDVTEMYAAMWAESVISAQNLHQCIQRSLQGAKYQKHVAAYFLTETLDSYWYHGPPRPHLDQAVKTAGAWLTAADLDLSALLAASYKVTWHSVTDDYSNPYYSSDKSPDKTKINQKKYPLCLQDAAVRAAHFEKFSQMIEKIPAGGHQLTGKPFPWHSAVLTREKVFELMMILAAYDGDKKKEARLWELAAKENPVSKMNFVRFFVCREISGRARNFLLELLADKNMQVRIYALRQLKTLTLTPSDIVRVADLLSLKTGEIRQTALELLKNTDDNILLGITQNLLTAKNANKRLAALDLLIYAKKSGKVTSAQAREMTQTMPQPTAAEMILLDNLLNNAAEYTPENGFGLYDPLYFPEFPAPERSSEYTLAAFRAITLTEMTEVWQSLLALVKEHQGKEYKAVSRYGSSWDGVFGNEKYLAQVTITDSPATIEDYFLGEVWGGWLEKNAARLLTILKIHYLCQMRPIHSWRYTAKEYTLENLEPFAQDLIVNLLGTEAQNFRQNIPAEFSQLVENIIQTLLGLKVDKQVMFAVNYGLLADFFLSVPPEDWSRVCYKKDNADLAEEEQKTSECLLNREEISFFAHNLQATTREEYQKKLALCYAMSKAAACEKRWCFLTEEDLAYGAQNGLVAAEELRRYCLSDSRLLSRYSAKVVKCYHQQTNLAAEYPVFAACIADVVKRVLEIELKRGDSATPVSKLALAIKYHEGAQNFAAILTALGQETLTRGYSWWSDGHTKRDVLSSLLKASVPAAADNAATFGAALSGRVERKRILEAVMYTPAWLSIAEDHLGQPGLKCAGWYFHAHTRTSYSAEFETEVARFSPIDREDLQRGAFDIDWFQEAYSTVGQEYFDLLYDCAKYIGSGATHRRAQLFADAVLGKLQADELEAQIREKRNKDLLLSYGLIPLAANKTADALRRYEFINEFLKKSREFGAQRQASEKEAANIALENLARNFGYTDVLRFNWKMEMEKFEAIEQYFKPYQVADTTLFLEFTAAGKAELICEKKGKLLKNIPAALKKDPYVKELHEVKTALKNQLSRSLHSLEKAMENRDEFTFGEARELLGHPVIGSLFRDLVFKCGSEVGFLSEKGLKGADGSEIKLTPKKVLTVAHCYDLFTSGKWRDLQRHAFATNLVQPFKQIFRELYLVNEDEKAEKIISRRYAGNQIQPKKAVALLKGRGWTVDYENGLQKVYHRENIVATMYALADWFSPSESEAPTLETVRFFERKSGKPVEFSAIDPILFSEVMRDVDLVVSVAHVGGVDPLASHSTTEMRSVIVTESMRLLQVKNIEVTAKHVKITGTYGEYSVHLGSGLAHRSGSGAIHILPVHSQHRGKIFLPFLDEDPKTAEIVAKVLLLAKDKEIKDPTIMSQIRK